MTPTTLYFASYDVEDEVNPDFHYLCEDASWFDNNVAEGATLYSVTVYVDKSTVQRSA